MSKEYLEALNYLYDTLRLSVYLGVVESAKIDSAKKCIEQALNRLEAIDNANPSEALEDLERIGSDYFLGSKDCLVKKIYEKEYNNIKQALLKQQEPKHYLKWEDLDFTDEEQTMKVILNGSVHFLSYYRNMFGGNLCMIDNTGITIWKENKNFFNDLHLERIE